MMEMNPFWMSNKMISLSRGKIMEPAKSYSCKNTVENRNHIHLLYYKIRGNSEGPDFTSPENCERIFSAVSGKKG